MSEIMSDIRLPLREATVWPDRIATTGHCQRHHAGPRIRQHLYDHQGVVGGEEVFCVGPNNSSPFATGATLNDSEQPVLVPQDLAQQRAPQADAHHAPSQVPGCCKVVEVHRLVGAVEGAHTDVDDTWRQCATVISGEAHVSCSGEHGVEERIGGHDDS